MHVLSWFDNRTLLACDFLLAIIFGVLFFSIKRIHPTLRGVGSIAICFLLGAPGTFLLASRGSIPYFISVTVANSFIFGSFIFLYRGILRFLGSRRTIFVPCLVSSFAMAILFYYSQVQNNIVPRIITLSITIGFIRGLIALELFRKSPTFNSPTIMRIFAAVMSLFAAISVNCGLMTFLHGAPSHNLQSTPIGTLTLLSGVLFVCLTGIFMLGLYNHELLARGRDESYKDALSGALNRRGIEAKLAVELKRFHRGKQQLTIGLIDIDYFKAINDLEGHPAGDAALRDIAHAISTRLRGGDSLGRYGGDEFLLILPATPSSVARVVVERLNQAVLSVRSLPLTLSIGITEAVLEDDALTLIARADKALYKAKDEGRNCWRIIKAETPSPLGREILENTTSSAMLTPNIQSSMLQR